MPPWSTTTYRATLDSCAAKCWRWSLCSVSRIGERLCSSANYVIEDELVARSVGREHKACFARHERLSEGAPCRLTLRIHSKADGPELHRRDRTVPVAPLWSCSQPDDESCLRLGEHGFE